MFLRCALHPINALSQGVGGSVIVCGELISERHDARSAGTALAAGHRHLGGEATAGKGTRAGCNAVFAMRDGGMLGMNSWNHENLKKIERQNTVLFALVEIRKEVGIYLKRPFAKGLARAR